MSDVATPPNDDSKLLFKLLVDRQWHPFYEIRDAVAEKVPPGRAIRAYEKDLAYRRQYRNDPSYNTALSDDEREKIGRRKCGSVVISSWREKGLDIRGEGSSKEIRAKPGFTSWGIPGFEPLATPESPGPPSESEGYTDIPPGDSESSEPAPVLVEKLVADYVLAPGGPAGRLVPQAAEVTQDGDDPSRSVQSLPTTVTVTRCPLCGIGVVDEALHRQWHEAEDQANAHPDMALLNESQLRDVVRDVMGQLLDEWQHGLQDWLQHEFAQVHGAIAVNRPPHKKWVPRSNQD